MDFKFGLEQANGQLTLNFTSDLAKFSFSGELSMLLENLSAMRSSVPPMLMSIVEGIKSSVNSRD